MTILDMGHGVPHAYIVDGRSTVAEAHGVSHRYVTAGQREATLDPRLAPWGAAIHRAQNLMRGQFPELDRSLPNEQSPRSHALRQILRANNYHGAENAFVMTHPHPEWRRSSVVSAPDQFGDYHSGIALHPEQNNYLTLAHEAGHLLHHQADGIDAMDLKDHDDELKHGSAFAHHYQRALQVVHPPAAEFFGTVLPRIKRTIDMTNGQHQAGWATPEPFTFSHEETQTGGTKHPKQVDLHAHHPDSNEPVGTLRYYPPKRRGGPVDVDNITTHHPGAGSALLNEMESRHPGSRTNFLYEVKRNNNNPSVTGHGEKGAGDPSDWDTHYPNLASEIHRGMALRLPSRSAGVVNSSAPKEDHLAELHDALSGASMGTHWTENARSAQQFAHNAVSDYRTTIPVVVHAQTPPLKDIETRRDPLYRGGVFPYGHSHSKENEVPIRKGRQLTVTGLSWRPDAPHPDADESGWVHHTYDEPMQRKAVTDKWPPYLTERPDEYGDMVPANISRHNPRGPVGTEDEARQKGWAGPYYHGTTKRRARDIRQNGFRQPRIHNWEMADYGTQEEVDAGNTHRTFFTPHREEAEHFGRAQHGDDSDVVTAYLHPDHLTTEEGGGFMDSTQVKDVAHAMAIRPARRTGKQFTPTKRLFGPTEGLDHRLFDGEHLKGDVREYIISTLSHFWEPMFGECGWEEWAIVYFAGSEASEWTSSALEGNNDFDVLIGVDYTEFRGCQSRTSKYQTMTDEEITADLNKGLRILDEQTAAAMIPVDGKIIGPFSNTWYVNQDSYDIRAIKPYAAYDVTHDRWAVKPPRLENWSLKDFPEGSALVQEARAVAAYVRAILKLPEPYRSQQGLALWNHLHSDRSRAFGPQGEGWFDPGNVIEKWLDQEGLWEKLVEIMVSSRAHPETLNTPTGWSNDPRSLA